MNNNRNKITFKKILVNQKLGYNSCPLFTTLTVQRHWKIHFLLALHSKFCKEKRWRCWKIHRFFSWSILLGDLPKWKTWKCFQYWFCEIHESDFSNDFVKYMKVISTLVWWNIWKWFQQQFYEIYESDFRLMLWNTWRWFQQWFCEPTRLWNTWKWFQYWFFFFSVKHMKVISTLVLFSRWPPRW